VLRDLAFVVDEQVPAGRVRTALIAAAGRAAASVVLFDVFTGDPVPPGKKSLAFSVAFRAHDRTLTDQEVDRTVAAIVEGLRAETGAELRSS
jgi:phenylalanyl-tRNA synthetase beta chain